MFLVSVYPLLLAKYRVNISFVICDRKITRLPRVLYSTDSVHNFRVKIFSPLMNSIGFNLFMVVG